MNINHILIITALTLLFSVSACKTDSMETPETPPAAAPTEMKLTAEGQEFKPPVQPAAIPGGSWYCDMGTVHYARSEKGDNTCPLCKMTLKEKVAVK